MYYIAGIFVLFASIFLGGEKELKMQVLIGWGIGIIGMAIWFIVGGIEKLVKEISELRKEISKPKKEEAPPETARTDEGSQASMVR
ncbi:MAG: hypothetical protein Q7S33_02340 [Nanoarchaeota archaeon]|nr:hypothetical protein [Nanoarchaeota archaeon]